MAHLGLLIAKVSPAETEINEPRESTDEIGIGWRQMRRRGAHTAPGTAALILNDH